MESDRTNPSTTLPSTPPRPEPWTPPAPMPSRFEALGLVIRRHTFADAPGLFKIIDASRATLVPWLPWAARTHANVEQTREEIARMDESFADLLRDDNNRAYGMVFGAFDAATGEQLGGSGINRLDPATLNAETGYWVRADRRRQGICTRILRAMLTWGFTPQHEGGFAFRRIHIFAADRNLASCGVPRKLGLQEHMQATADRWIDGLGWCGTTGWEVLADEWDRREMRRVV